MKINSFLSFCLLLHLLGITAWSQDYSGQAQWTETGLPHIENYSPDEYDSNPMNWGMVRDDRGILYVANLNGILEFDGVTWRTDNVPKDSWVLSVAKDSSGTIYAGLFGDFGFLGPDSLGKMQFKSLLNYVAENDRDFKEIWRIHCTKTGTYFRSRDKIFLWSENVMKVLRTSASFSLTSVVDDTLYVVEHGVGLKKTGGDSLILIEDSRRLLPLGFTNILPYDSNQKLVCSRKGLFLFDGNKFSPFKSPVNEFIKEKSLSSAAALAGGKFAIGTYQGGACVIDRRGNILYKLNKSSGLQNEDIKNVYTDSDGTLWLALNFGLAHVRVHDPATYFAERQGLKGNVVSIIRHKGTIYAETSQEVYYLETINSKTSKQAEKENNLPVFSPVKGISSQGFWLLSAGNDLLVATTSGVYKIEGYQANEIGPVQESAFVLHRSKRDSNIVYAGLKNGLAQLKFQNDKWISNGRINGITEEIRTIVEDPDDGSLWLGTVFEGALNIKITNKDEKGWNAEIQRFTTAQGLPDGPVNISKIDDRIIFATKKGLRHFDKRSQCFYPDSTIAEELADTTLSTVWIEQDRFGQVFVWPHKPEQRPRFWKLQKDNDGNFVIDHERFRPLSSFGTFHTTYSDPDSVLWIGCSTGIVRYDQKMKVEYASDYPALIRRISVITSDSLIFDGFESANFRKPVLSYENNALRFEYSTTFLENKAANCYQFRLQGFEDNWSNWTTETKKDYTNLKYGTYNFEIRAINTYGKLSKTAGFGFEILPPWYFSRWAYAGYFILFIAGIIFVQRIMRVQLVKKEQKKAELREAEIVNRKNMELQEKNTQLEEILLLLQNAQNSLIESESRFRSVAESANDAIITADESGNITFWNKRAETIFGYSKEEAVGQPLTMLMPDHHRDAHLNGMKRYFSTGKVKIMGHVIDIEAVNKNGEEFPIELSLSDWETHEGKYVTGIVRDITKRKQEEEALRNTQAQLFQSEKMSTLGKLSAGMAHELNNPVSSAKRSAAQMKKMFVDLQLSYFRMSKLNLSEKHKELLMEIAQKAKECAENPANLDPSTRSDKEQEIEKWLEDNGITNAWELASPLVNMGYNPPKMNKYIDMFSVPQLTVVLNWQSAIYTIYSLLYEIDLGTERISEIVKVFKTYTYMDRAPLQTVNIHRDLDNTLIIFSSKLKNGITVLKEYDKDLPNIEAYGSELNQVWSNLIDNAIDAMDGKGKLILHTSKSGTNVNIEITDTGPGIPAQIHSKIFDPFFTTKKIGMGTGMGLSICHNIIEQKHHGRISLSSEPGKTTFSISLPIRFESGN